MRILFDQGVPVPLSSHLTGHTIDTAFARGWSTMVNGLLLDAAEQAGYDILISTDQNLKHQQNLTGRKLAIIVLCSTSWPLIQQHIPEIQSTVDGIQPGGYAEVQI